MRHGDAERRALPVEIGAGDIGELRRRSCRRRHSAAASSKQHQLAEPVLADAVDAVRIDLLQLARAPPSLPASPRRGRSHRHRSWPGSPTVLPEAGIVIGEIEADDLQRPALRRRIREGRLSHWRRSTARPSAMFQSAASIPADRPEPAADRQQQRHRQQRVDHGQMQRDRLEGRRPGHR